MVPVNAADVAGDLPDDEDEETERGGELGAGGEGGQHLLLQLHLGQAGPGGGQVQRHARPGRRHHPHQQHAQPGLRAHAGHARCSHVWNNYRNIM